MYVYRNKKTGDTFSSPCICSGDNWEMITGAESKVAPVQQDDTEDSDVLDDPDDTESPKDDGTVGAAEQPAKQDEKKRRGRRKADA